MEREHKDVHSFLGFAIQTPLAVVWLLRRWIAALFPGLGWLQGAWESWKSCEECAEVGHCWTWNCVRYMYCILYMVVSWNRGTPNYPFIEGFSMIYQPLLVQLDTYGKSSYFGYGISMAVRSRSRRKLERIKVAQKELKERETSIALESRSHSFNDSASSTRYQILTIASTLIVTDWHRISGTLDTSGI